MLENNEKSALFRIPPMKYLIEAAPSLLYIGLVRILALHFHNKIKIFLPNDELFNRRRLPHHIQRLNRLFFNPLIIVVLLSHGHLPNRRSL